MTRNKQSLSQVKLPLKPIRPKPQVYLTVPVNECVLPSFQQVILSPQCEPQCEVNETTISNHNVTRGKKRTWSNSNNRRSNRHAKYVKIDHGDVSKEKCKNSTSFIKIANKTSSKENDKTIDNTNNEENIPDDSIAQIQIVDVKSVCSEYFVQNEESVNSENDMSQECSTLVPKETSVIDLKNEKSGTNNENGFLSSQKKIFKNAKRIPIPIIKNNEMGLKSERESAILKTFTKIAPCLPELANKPRKFFNIEKCGKKNTVLCKNGNNGILKFVPPSFCNDDRCCPNLLDVIKLKKESIKNLLSESVHPDTNITSTKDKNDALKSRVIESDNANVHSVSNDKYKIALKDCHVVLDRLPNTFDFTKSIKYSEIKKYDKFGSSSISQRDDEKCANSTDEKSISENININNKISTCVIENNELHKTQHDLSEGQKTVTLETTSITNDTERKKENETIKFFPNNIIVVPMYTFQNQNSVSLSKSNTPDSHLRSVNAILEKYPKIAPRAKLKVNHPKIEDKSSVDHIQNKSRSTDHIQNKSRKDKTKILTKSDENKVNFSSGEDTKQNEELKRKVHIITENASNCKRMYLSNINIRKLNVITDKYFNTDSNEGISSCICLKTKTGTCCEQTLQLSTNVDAINLNSDNDCISRQLTENKNNCNLEAVKMECSTPVSCIDIIGNSSKLKCLSFTELVKLSEKFGNKVFHSLSLDEITKKAIEDLLEPCSLSKEMSFVATNCLNYKNNSELGTTEECSCSDHFDENSFPFIYKSEQTVNVDSNSSHSSTSCCEMQMAQFSERSVVESDALNGEGKMNLNEMNKQQFLKTLDLCCVDSRICSRMNLCMKTLQENGVSYLKNPHIPLHFICKLLEYVKQKTKNWNSCCRNIEFRPLSLQPVNNEIKHTSTKDLVFENNLPEAISNSCNIVQEKDCIPDIQDNLPETISNNCNIVQEKDCIPDIQGGQMLMLNDQTSSIISTAKEKPIIIPNDINGQGSGWLLVPIQIIPMSTANCSTNSQISSCTATVTCNHSLTSQSYSFLSNGNNNNGLKRVSIPSTVKLSDLQPDNRKINQTLQVSKFINQTRHNKLKISSSSSSSIDNKPNHIPQVYLSNSGSNRKNVILFCRKPSIKNNFSLPQSNVISHCCTSSHHSSTCCSSKNKYHKLS